jgi:hypothetical protein
VARPSAFKLEARVEIDQSLLLNRPA